MATANKKALDLAPLYELGLSESEVTLYLAMIDHGALTAQEIVKYTHTKRPTVYYAMRQLVEKGLVHKTGTEAIERFQAEPPGKLLAVLLMRRQKLEGLESAIKDLIPNLTPSNTPREGVPKILFYEGEQAMKQAIMETLYCRTKKVDYITPHDNFFWQTDKRFAEQYVKERKDRTITTRHLWEQPLTPQYMGNFKDVATVRLLPKSMCDHFRTTTLLYDDTVMYISSQKSGYVLLVKSKEHYELMSSVFNVLWDISASLS